MANGTHSAYLSRALVDFLDLAYNGVVITVTNAFIEPPPTVRGRIGGEQSLQSAVARSKLGLARGAAVDIDPAPHRAANVVRKPHHVLGLVGLFTAHSLLAGLFCGLGCRREAPAPPVVDFGLHVRASVTNRAVGAGQAAPRLTRRLDLPAHHQRPVAAEIGPFGRVESRRAGKARIVLRLERIPQDDIARRTADNAHVLAFQLPIRALDHWTWPTCTNQQDAKTEKISEQNLRVITCISIYKHYSCSEKCAC